MKTSEKISTALAVALLFGLLALGIYLMKLLLSNLDKINPNIIAAIIAGAITFTGYFVTRHLEKRKEIELQIREQKLPIYEEFMGFFFKFVFDEDFKKLGADEKDAETLNFMVKFSQKSIMWFSDESLKSFIEWKRMSSKLASQQNVDHTYQLVLFEKMLIAFRKDVGHSNKNITTGDLLSIFVTDIDNYKDQLAQLKNI